MKIATGETRGKQPKMTPAPWRGAVNAFCVFLLAQGWHPSPREPPASVCHALSSSYGISSTLHSNHKRNSGKRTTHLP